MYKKHMFWMKVYAALAAMSYSGPIGLQRWLGERVLFHGQSASLESKREIMRRVM